MLALNSSLVNKSVGNLTGFYASLLLYVFEDENDGHGGGDIYIGVKETSDECLLMRMGDSKGGRQSLFD